MEKDLRYILLKHIDQVAFNSIHASCIENILRSSNIEILPLSELTTKVLKEKIQKYRSNGTLTLFGDFEGTINQKIILFLTNFALYNITHIYDTVKDWFRDLFKIYISRSISFHLSEDIISRVDELADILSNYMFSQKEIEVRRYTLRATWSSNKPLLEKVIDSLYFLLDERVSRSTLLINVNHSYLATILSTIEKYKADSNITIQNYFNRLYIMYTLTDEVKLTLPLKKAVRDISLYACEKLKPNE